MCVGSGFFHHRKHGKLSCVTFLCLGVVVGTCKSVLEVSLVMQGRAVRNAF